MYQLELYLTYELKSYINRQVRKSFVVYIPHMVPR